MQLTRGLRSFFLFFVVSVLLVGGFTVSGCIVRELSTNGLPCGSKGECSSGLKCYVVGDRGNLCLEDSKGFALYKPGTEPAKEPTPEPAKEVTPDDASVPEEPTQEPPSDAGEPTPEPTPEVKPEPGEPTTDGSTEPTPDNSTSDTKKDA